MAFLAVASQHISIGQKRKILGIKHVLKPLQMLLL